MKSKQVWEGGGEVNVKAKGRKMKSACPSFLEEFN